MVGGLGDDIYYVDNAGDMAVEAAGSGTDRVFSSISHTLAANVENLNLNGSAASNATGNALANGIVGNSAANTISGGLGADMLTGGAGSDMFLFDAALDGSFDRITDFSTTDDTIGLDLSIFAALSAAGTLDIAAFRAGTVAADADDPFIYDSATGNIYYDADGNGAASATLFAQVAIGTALSSGDFLILT